MSKGFRFPHETDDVYRVLVGELATSWLPTTIMACTFVGVGGLIAVSHPSLLLIAATIVGGILSLVKLVVMRKHREALTLGEWTRLRSARWELAHAVLTVGFAIQVGLVTALVFLESDPASEMLATGMLFGYCSGIAARVSFRPVISAAALVAAGLPASVGAALQGGVTGGVLAVIFIIFLLGALETVRYLYGVSSRQIALTLDMATLARHDPLTGLYNRLGLREAFRARVASQRIGLVAVHCMDLDGFKPVNDQYGHAAGDLLLSGVANRLRGLVGPNGIVSRLGGDEFVAVQAPISHVDEANLLALRICRGIKAPFLINGVEMQVGASVGYTVSTSEGRDLEALIATADEALYRVKKAGGGSAAQRTLLVA